MVLVGVILLPYLLLLHTSTSCGFHGERFELDVSHFDFGSIYVFLRESGTKIV